MTTHVTFVLDETGSMKNLKDETISGFNKYVEDMCNDGQEYTFSLLKFDSAHKTWTNRKVSPRDAVKLNVDNYRPGAMTPLLDTVFYAVKETEKDTVQSQKVMIIVLTDGLENASTDTTVQVLSDLIKYKEAEGWAFVYLGVTKEAWKNDKAFAGTGLSSNAYHTSGVAAMDSAFISASSTRTTYSASRHTDVQHLIDDEERQKVESKNQ